MSTDLTAKVTTQKFYLPKIAGNRFMNRPDFIGG